MPRPDYGLDAPGVVRNLALVAMTGLGLCLAVIAGWIPPHIAIPLGPARVAFDVIPTAASSGGGCGLMAGWMFWSSRVGKVRERARLLDRVAWTGTERVLDVGCGRGLLLVGVARRLTTGRVSGIDIWNAEDLSGNRPEAALINAEREGVADCVDVQTADMRAMPFPDATFDRVVSRFAIHNLYTVADRAKAIAEIARVLAPGGQALIEDIRHRQEYLAAFAIHGCVAAAEAGSPVTRGLLAAITMGTLVPGTLIVRKGSRTV